MAVRHLNSQVVVAQRLSRLLTHGLEDNNLQRASHKPPAKLEALARSQLTQHSVALARHLHRHLMRHGSRGSSWSRRIGKNMKVSERELLNEAAAFFK